MAGYPRLMPPTTTRLRIDKHALTFALLVASALGACGGSDSTSDSTNVPFTTVAQSSNSAIAASEGVVARTLSELNALWVRHSANMSPPPPPPVIDFNVTQVVGYFLGARPNGCHSMTITRITQTSRRLVVTYKEQVPATGAICTQVVVTPAYLVAVPMSQLPVEFLAE